MRKELLSPPGRRPWPLVGCGSVCTWWDSIEKATVVDGGDDVSFLCPNCGGVLVVKLEGEWEALMVEFEARSPVFSAYITWLRGRCFPTFHEAKVEFIRHLSQAAVGRSLD